MAAQSNIGENHADVSAADEHGCESCFRGFAFDDVEFEFAVFQQRSGELAQSGVVLDDQYGGVSVELAPFPASLLRDICRLFRKAAVHVDKIP